jgi:hypothetical protein
VLPIDVLVLPLADPPVEHSFPHATDGHVPLARAIADAVNSRITLESTRVVDSV